MRGVCVDDLFNDDVYNDVNVYKPTVLKTHTLSVTNVDSTVEFVIPIIQF